jgi:5'-nucleotidase
MRNVLQRSVDSLRPLKIVVTNDDGIDAPGIAVLHRLASQIGEATVVAPLSAHSGAGHGVTAHRPLDVTCNRPGWYAVSGTPADCARVALKVLVPDADWLLAGINPGANLGSDIYNSGTVAAAREAAMLGCRSAAVSQYIARDQTIEWATTGGHAETLLQWLLRHDLSPAEYWNANLPHPLSPDDALRVVLCEPDPLPHAFDYRRQGDRLTYSDDIHVRPRIPGRDVAVCFGGAVSVSRLALAGSMAKRRTTDDP